MDGLSRLSEMSRQILALAKKEAAFFQHDQIRTEHILLAIAAVPEAVASRLLRRQGIDPQIVVREVVAYLQIGKVADARAITLGNSSRECIVLAGQEAERLGSEYIGTEHLLLGLLGDPESIAGKVLLALGVDADQVRRHAAGLTDSAPPRSPVDPQSRANPAPGRTPAGGAGERQRDSQGRRGGGKPEEDKSSLLSQYGRDLTQMARSGKFDPLIGREVQLERLAQILLRKQKNNPVLVGEAGVGKTAIVEGLARAIVSRDVPDALRNLRLIQLDLPGIVSGTRFRGDFEERLKAIVAEIVKAGDIIVFIDELHMLMTAGGGASGALGAASLLKPALARGQIRCIGATTWKEYRRYIEADGALARRFQAITVDEPSVEDANRILEALRPAYEQFHGVAIGDGAIHAATTMSARYLTERSMPDKAIDLIDEALARVKVRRLTPPDALRQVQRLRDQAKIEREAAIEWREFDRATLLGEEEKRLSTEAEQIRLEWRGRLEAEASSISQRDIAEVVAAWTGVPVQNLTESQQSRFLNLEQGLRERVVGQAPALEALGRALRRNAARLGDPSRPVGSFLFVGPSGVGKTEVARSLASYLFDTEDALIRFDMSEFSEYHTVSRLIGAPPGYVGYEAAGDLTERVRRRPYSVVLFDEVDKAHPRLLTSLLQVLDSGHLSDGQGRKVNFRNTVIIMTANYGSEQLKTGRLGFAVDGPSSGPKDIRGIVEGEVKRRLLPEFLNRLDGTVVFEPLTEKNLHAISRMLLARTAATATARSIVLTWDDAVLDWLSKRGYAARDGARPIRQLIRQHIEDGLVDGFYSDSRAGTRTVHVSVRDDALVLTTASEETLPEGAADELVVLPA